MEKISVVVPVYNTEKYLVQCVESIQAQSHSHFEILLVNDGSTDDSGSLCDELMRTDNRIRVFHKANGGASSARNVGIRQATGQRLLFMDSDDFYASTTLFEHLLTFDVDLVCFNYCKMNDNTKKIGAPKIAFKETLSGNTDEDLLLLTQSNAYADSACQKCVKTDVIKDNDVYFAEGLLGEDIEWNAKLMPWINSVAFLDGEYYVYRMIDGSASHTRTQKQLMDIFSILDWICRRQHPRLAQAVFLRAYYTYAAFNYCTTLVNIRFVDKQYLNENLAHCKKYKWLLQYDGFGQVKLVHWAVRLLGLRMASWLLHTRSAMVRRRYALR